MNILSIQSHVAYGHVGNSAAVFPLQRIGVEVWPVHTVQFSNHTGYGAWRGRAFSGEAIRGVVEGIDERGVLGECDGVISGYLGTVDVGEAVIDIVARVKGANPAARYCCDPVIGDVGRGVFVRRGVPELIKERALPMADFATPNQFGSISSAAAARHVVRRWPRSRRCMRWDRGGADLAAARRPGRRADLIASDGVGRFRLRTPLLPLTANGAGD